MFNRITGLAVCLCLVSAAGLAMGQDQRVIRIEEDWELIVETPDPLQDAPQVSTLMSPTDSLDEIHFGLDLNHAQKANYDGGGFQTKAINGSTLMADSINNSGSNLNQSGEVIRWTQLMAVFGQEIVFAVKDGTSQSWGSFGGPETLVRQPTQLTNLNGYSPYRSAEWSGVGFASNRVASLKLARVRVVFENGDVSDVPVNLVVQ